MSRTSTSAYTHCDRGTTPPADTRVGRLRRWSERHPRLYAARHVVINALGTAIAVLGIGALVSAFFGRLLPAIELGWLPDVGAPDWLEYLDPARYLAPMFAWVPPLLDQLLGWIPDVEPGWAKYVIGFLVAVFVAVREVRRRKRAAGDAGEKRAE